MGEYRISVVRTKGIVMLVFRYEANEDSRPLGQFYTIVDELTFSRRASRLCTEEGRKLSCNVC